MYRGEYGRADEASRTALDAAEQTSDPEALVDALRARQLARCGPDGSGERVLLATRMLGAAREAGSAWVEMWGRLWRIDTLFETGQLPVIARELAELASCVKRVPVPVARWHLLQYSATHAYAAGRYADAVRLAGEAFKVMTDMGHPAGIRRLCGRDVPDRHAPRFRGARRGGAPGPDPAGHVARGVGCGGTVGERDAPRQPGPDVADRGDRDQAARMYELARPVQSWAPLPSLRLIAWAQGLAVAIGLGRNDDIAYLSGALEPLRGRHVASGAGAGSYLGPVVLHLGKAAAALGALDVAIADLETAASICTAIGAPGFAMDASVELAATLVRRGTRADTDRACALLAAAAPEARRLGMAPSSRRIEDLRTSLSAGPPPLSPREQEVARLVG